MEEIVEISWWWKRTILTLDIRELQSRARLFRSNFSPGPLVPRHLQSSVLRFTERSVSTKCPVLVSNDPYPCWTFLKHIISWRVEAKQVPAICTLGSYPLQTSANKTFVETILPFPEDQTNIRLQLCLNVRNLNSNGSTCDRCSTVSEIATVHFAVYATYMPME